MQGGLAIGGHEVRRQSLVEPLETVVLLSGEKVDGHININPDVEKLKMARKEKF